MHHLSDRDRELARSMCEDFMTAWEPGVPPAEVVDRLLVRRWPSVVPEARRELCHVLSLLFHPLMFRDAVLTDDVRERCVALVAAWQRQQCRDGLAGAAGSS